MAIAIDSSVIDRLIDVDPDRVRAARLAEPDVRDQLFALYAFHMELARVPELVSEPMMGNIRYQWWRDCLDEIYGNGTVRSHEVATPLAEMVAQTGISRFLLGRIIDGRERDLDPRPFANIHAAVDYADATSGTLAIAAVAICSGTGGKAAGRAWGLTGLARSYRYYADAVLQDIAFPDIIAAADTAFSEGQQIKLGDALPALAYVSTVPGFLKRMNRTDYDPSQNVPNYAPFLKQLRMLGSVAASRL